MVDYEYNLCYKQAGVLIFKLPPISSASGHYLDNWKDVIWEGGVRVTAKGDFATVSFINKDGSIQATCPVPQKHQEAVQKTVDSSRGFAIRLKDPQGKFKWVVRDRNDAFDFNVSLVDFEEKREIEKNPGASKSEFELQQDLSLKQGQKIKLNLGGMGGESSNSNTSSTQQKNQKIDFGFGQLAQQTVPNQNQNQFASFDTFSSKTQAVPNQNQNQFSSFDTFSSQPGFTVGQQQQQKQNFDFGFNQFQPAQQQQQSQQQSGSSKVKETNLLDL